MPSKKKRISYFAEPDEANQLEYFLATYPERWPSESELVREAVKYYISFINQDFELATLEQQRLNQLIDIIATLSADFNSLESVVTEGFKSLLTLTRGDNYLINVDDDGELE